MFKKLFIAALVVGAGVFILRSTHLGSYAKTMWTKAQASLKGTVPLEMQIEALRNDAADLPKEINKHISAIAAEKVAVNSLHDEVADLKVSLNSRRDNVQAMTNALKPGVTKVVYGGNEYSAERIRAKLAKELDTGKKVADLLKYKQQLLDTREKSLQIAIDQLEAMKFQKEQINLEIASLEAELKNLRLAETQSKFQIDDSKLSHVKSTLSEIKTQISVEKEKLAMMNRYGTETSVEEPKVKSTSELTKEAQVFLGTGVDSEEAVAEKR